MFPFYCCSKNSNFYFYFRDDLIKNCFEFEDKNRPRFIEINEFLKDHYAELHDDYVNPSKIKVELKLSALEKILLNIKKHKWILLIGLLFFLLALFGLLCFEQFSIEKPAETTTTFISKYISKNEYSELYNTTTSVVSSSKELEYSDKTTNSGLVHTTKTVIPTSARQNIADKTLNSFKPTSTTKAVISTTLKAENSINSKFKGKNYKINFWRVYCSKIKISYFPILIY